MNKSKSGFTIVELLIVIVIIGILAAITIVAYNGIKEKAQTAKKQSDTAVIEQKMELYFTANSAYPASPTVAKSDADLGGLTATIYAASDSRYDCDDAGTVTKENYCLFGDSDGYGIIWWDNAAKLWRGYEHYTNGNIYNDTYGSGTLPSIPG